MALTQALGPVYLALRTNNMSSSYQNEINLRYLDGRVAGLHTETTNRQKKSPSDMEGLFDFLLFMTWLIQPKSSHTVILHKLFYELVHHFGSQVLELAFEEIGKRSLDLAYTLSLLVQRSPHLKLAYF